MSERCNRISGFEQDALCGEHLDASHASLDNVPDVGARHRFGGGLTARPGELSSPSKRLSDTSLSIARPYCRVYSTSDLNSQCVWTDLPTELMGLIVEQLSADEIQMARLVCRDWRRIISASVASLKPHYFDGTNTYHEVFSQVTRLDLRNCASTLNDHGLLCALQPFDRLHKLDLSGCTNLTDESFRMLFDRDSSPLKRNLTWLSLQNVVKITDDSIFSLCGKSTGSHRDARATHRPGGIRRSIFPTLTVIDNGRTSAAAALATQTKRYACSVDFNGTQSTARNPAHNISRGAVRLEYLDLSGCLLLSDRSMMAIRTCLPNLNDLRLGGYSRTSSVGDSMLLHLAEGKHPSSDSCLSNVQRLDLSGCITVTSVGLKPVLSHFHRLHRLNLWNCMSLRSESLESLSSPRGHACLDLRELSLRGCHGIDDGAFQHISALSKLEVLDMRSCEQVSGGSIGLLRLTKLRRLNMKSCFGLTNLSGIAQITSVEVLNLSDCWQIRVDALGHLASLINLVELNLSGCRNICNGSGRGLPAIACMKRLVSLCLRCCERIQDGALSSLAALPNLRHLDISRCTRLPASDLKYLWNIGSLTRLTASHCSWSGCSALRSIGPLKALEELYLRGCPNLVGTSFEPLKRLRNLKHLVLDGCTNTPLFDRGLVSIASSLKSLSDLSLQNCVTIGDSGIASLGQLENLEVVDLSDCCGITGDGFRYWNHMHKLRVVILQGCSGITDKGVEDLVSRNHSILELNLKQCRRITDKAIFCVVDHLPRITSLSLQASMGVTDEGVSRLAERGRHLQSLAIQFCWQFGDVSAIKLAKMPWLKHLDLLYSWKITDVAIHALAASNSLVELNIFGCHRVSHQARQRIASKLSPMCR